MPLSAKENYLEAIRNGNPEYVPLMCEPIWRSVSFKDMIRLENWTDRFGVTWEMGIEGAVPFPKGNPLSDIKNRLSDYKFPDPGGLETDPDAIEDLKKIDRGNTLITGSMTYFCFERAWALTGLENFLIALIEYPDEIHFLLHELAKYARAVFDRYLEMGVDGVSFSEDLGTQRALLMSPALFREFFIPEYRYAFENVIKEKKIINFHSCGCVTEIIGDLADIGVSVLNPIQARANDLEALKNGVTGRTALQGGIDTHMIMTGKPDDIRVEVIRVMGLLKPGGGYICGPDQSFPVMPEDNMRMLWETAREIGKY